jgi:interferon, gamma-inducible protein 30
MKILIVIVIQLICLGLLVSSHEKVRVDIHIESRCKFSSKFILSQLDSATLENIQDFVDLHFYVFGKSGSYHDRNGDLSFVCQHGDLECYLNMYQTCVLDLIGTDTERAVQFVVCAMNFTNIYSDCVELIELNQSDVNECIIGPKGTLLQLEVERIANPIIGESKKVPTIVYNGFFDQNLSSLSQVDFIGGINSFLSAA